MLWPQRTGRRKKKGPVAGQRAQLRHGGGRRDPYPNAEPVGEELIVRGDGEEVLAQRGAVVGRAAGADAQREGNKQTLEGGTPNKNGEKSNEHCRQKLVAS